MMHHLARDLERLKAELLSMGGMVEEATETAVRSVVERRGDLARQVIDGDDRVDDRELDLEDHCLKILALHQPVAVDLRFIVVAMKVNNDLERVGDLAVNIAERALELAGGPVLGLIEEIQAISEKVRAMLRHSLDALVEPDPELARQVCRDDEEIDARHRALFTEIGDEIRRDPSNIDTAIRLLSCSRYLERIADHATNVAEDVIFLVEGQIVRHRLTDEGSASG